MHYAMESRVEHSAWRVSLTQAIIIKLLFQLSATHVTSSHIVVSLNVSFLALLHSDLRHILSTHSNLSIGYDR